MEHPPTSSAIADHAATIANLSAQLEALNTVSSAIDDGMRLVIKDRDATIAKLKEHNATLLRVIEDGSNEITDRKASAAHLQDAIAEARDDRASIVAFLAATAERCVHAGRKEENEGGGRTAARAIYAEGRVWLDASRAIERGDDRQGGE